MIVYNTAVPINSGVFLVHIFELQLHDKVTDQIKLEIFLIDVVNRKKLTIEIDIKNSMS